MMEEVANNVLPVSEPGGLSKAAFQAPVKMASTAEYGRIVIFKKGKICHYLDFVDISSKQNS